MLPRRARIAPKAKISSEKPLIEKLVESDEEPEVEIMRRLIAKGKVRRSTLKRFNTGLKWLLDNVVAMEVCGLCISAFESIWARKSVQDIWSNMKMGLRATTFAHKFSIEPVTSLLSYIIIPVQHRLTLIDVDMVGAK
ncbi:hypothetical protein EJ03DRAFT_1948 [Teratosphaeria nubilosa]|uniref:Uncharacterized protein n=1 Tax=Teratosphaeria nubilosa TaxID=161662 RepID=A0A6G1LNH9_9PEZI|nr:hypothetical protein EJ03DRAFT_1948 [Teratosphaeria nubilosa]